MLFKEQNLDLTPQNFEDEIGSADLKKVKSVHLEEFKKGVPQVIWDTLSECELDSINLGKSRVLNTQVLYEYPGLESISIRKTELAEPIDFRNFPNLEFVWFDRPADTVNLATRDALKQIRFWSFDESAINAAFADVKGDVLPNVTNLDLYRCRFSDFSCLPAMPGLESIHSEINKSLQSMNGIERQRNLRFISIENSPELCDFEALTQIDGFAWLTTNKTGKVSLDLIERLPSLVSFGTKSGIIEDDLTRLTKHPRLKNVYLRRERRYSHSENELNAALQADGRGEIAFGTLRPWE